MSVEFSNAYQEILFDNLVSIIKQNFVFQTQLKLVEKTTNEVEELKKKNEELTKLYDSSKVDSTQFEIYKNKAEQNSSAHEEKNRIQTALNDLMKKNSSLTNEIENKNKEIQDLKTEKEKLNDYVKKLQEIIPTTKLKKLNNEKTIEVKNDAPKNEVINDKILNTSDGSSF